MSLRDEMRNTAVAHPWGPFGTARAVTCSLYRTRTKRLDTMDLLGVASVTSAIQKTARMPQADFNRQTLIPPRSAHSRTFRAKRSGSSMIARLNPSTLWAAAKWILVVMTVDVPPKASSALFTWPTTIAQQQPRQNLDRCLVPQLAPL